MTIKGVEVQSLAEMVGPYLPFLGVIFGGLIVGAFAVYNRKRGNLEVKMPTVVESWAETQRMRDEFDELYQKYRNLIRIADALRQLFREYVTRVHRGGSSALLPAEKAAINLPEVSDEDYPTITPAQLDSLRTQEKEI